MKLRNLIFSLFLAIGAIGFTACTGDDGAQGPQGPPGPAGPPGEPGEGAEESSREYSYPFLANWGEADARLSCEDELLTGTGVFPGPALELLPIGTQAEQLALVTASAGTEATANGYVSVSCPAVAGVTVFAATPNPDLNGDGAGDIPAANLPTGSPTGLIFIKTHRASEMSSDRVEATTSSPALVTTVTKTFSGGKVAADMDTSGSSDEPRQREQLYHDCSVGTAPSAIAGDWRAVTIVDRSVNVRLSDTGATRGLQEEIANTDVTKTTKKVCVSLDSLPGAVKCYVKQTVAVAAAGGTAVGNAAGVMVNTGTDTIGIYNPDGTLTPVMPAAALAGTANAGQVGPANSTDDVQFIANSNDFQGAKLCNLFRESAPAF